MLKWIYIPGFDSHASNMANTTAAAASSRIDDNDVNASADCSLISVKEDDDQLSSVGRTGTVTFRPYTDLCRGPPKKRFRGESNEEESHLAAKSGTTVDHLYPELVCLLFAYLDVESKGRAAQVSLPL